MSLKVVFCAYDYAGYVGGPNAWLKRLVLGLRDCGIKSKILFITGDPIEKCPTVNFFHKNKIEYAAVEEPLYTEEKVLWIIKELTKDQPDVFVANLMVPAYYAGYFLRQAGIPTIGVLHSDDDFHYALLDEFVFGRPAYRIEGIVCVSKFLEAQVLLRRPSGILIQRIPCGVPIPQDSVQLPQDRIRLVYTGRLTEKQKRISDLTRALCRVVKEIPCTEAVIYGGGNALNSVKQIITYEAKGLPIYYAGRIESEEIQEHLLKFHIFVLLSDYEGLPISLMEAMACGLVPVCLSLRSGILELIENEINGLLVKNREEDFLNAIRKLQSQPQLWKKLSLNARAKIEKEYSLQICIKKWSELLYEVHKKFSKCSKKLGVPTKIVLPSVHPGLSREDRRKPKMWFFFSKGIINMKKKTNREKKNIYSYFFNSRFYAFRLLYHTMKSIAKKYLSDKKRTILVDFGCGDMPYRLIFQDYVEKYIAVDLTKNKKADFYSDNYGKTILDDNFADIVLSTQVLEHVEKPEDYLNECFRILRPGGILILSTHGYWRYHPDPQDLWRWTSQGLKKIIQDRGFQILEFRGLMGLVSISLQLFQDGIMDKIPRFLRNIFVFIIQRLILIMDKVHSLAEREKDAGYFVVVASKKKEEIKIDNCILDFELKNSSRKNLNLSNINICIISPQKEVYSETFIKAHRERLPAKIKLLYGDYFPIYTEDGSPLLSQRFLMRTFRYLSKKFFLLPHFYFQNKALKDFLIKNKIELVLAEYGPTGASIMSSCKEARVPFIVHFHGYDAYCSDILEKFNDKYQEMFHLASAIVVVSKDMMQQLLRLGAPLEKLFYNPYGVDTSLFKGACPKEAAPIFLAVGRFVEKKAPHLTILAFKKVLEVCPESKLIFVGDGKLLNACKLLVETLRIKDSVEFLGVRTPLEVSFLMRKVRAFVQHSVTAPDGDKEGMPVAILEAGISGLPVISTYHAGIKEIVIDNQTGFLVEELNIEAMADRMILLAENANLAAELGKKAREYLSERFSIERSISNFWDIIERIINNYKVGKE